MTELHAEAGWGPRPELPHRSDQQRRAIAVAEVPHAQRGAADPGEWRFARSDGVLWRHNGTAVVCLTPHTGAILTLRGAGALLWQLLSQPCTAAELGTALATVFRVPGDAVRVELDPVLDRLVDLEVVRSVAVT